MFVCVAELSPRRCFPLATDSGREAGEGKPVTAPVVIISQMVVLARPACNGSQAALPSEAV